ncbi:MAG TPA: rRNA adenine N-6-methyltransferase family protein [Rubrivivax sp.]|nr:protein-L-isoaspartate O-methyltransferase [Pseudomonadota bacterium]HOL36776.1 rRNA adenine N-6-methyltransferase family protein [Rubrivivax sp.]HPP83510.1 rRNA adenine N-6-methyltransferase family protein [Rubrivivax sp.]
MSRPGRRFPLPLARLHGAPRPATRELLRPQRPLQQAAQDAARRHIPSGLGLDSAAVRARMVQRLRAEGIDDERVLAAFAAVERHRFVDSALAIQAYEDTSLPIGHGQTISKPSVVARMLVLALGSEFARSHGHLGRVLEIGTGCGYQTALLVQLARSVVSIERLQPLAERARETLGAHPLPAAAAPPACVTAPRPLLLHADGRLGHAARAPYDTIVCAAGGEQLPAPWIEQLATDGRLVAPTQGAGLRGQRLAVVDRHRAGVRQQEFDAVHFVPLKSGVE